MKVRFGSSGWTLVELRVVLAILALLSAFLFPVLVRAKEAGRQTQCGSQWKPITSAVLLSLADHNDRFPLALYRVHQESEDGLATVYQLVSIPTQEVSRCPSDAHPLDWLNGFRSARTGLGLPLCWETVPRIRSIGNGCVLVYGDGNAIFVSFGSLSYAPIPYPAQTSLFYEGTLSTAKVRDEDGRLHGFRSSLQARHGSFRRFTDGHLQAVPTRLERDPQTGRPRSHSQKTLEDPFALWYTVTMWGPYRERSHLRGVANQTSQGEGYLECPFDQPPYSTCEERSP